MKQLEMHTSSASQWNDSTKALTSVLANDTPRCTIHVPAVKGKRMLEVEVPPEPGLADDPRDSDIGLKAIRESAPRGQPVPPASSLLLIFQKTPSRPKQACVSSHPELWANTGGALPTPARNL